jgi:hypothetical protein
LGFSLHLAKIHQFAGVPLKDAEARCPTSRAFGKRISFPVIAGNIFPRTGKCEIKGLLEVAVSSAAEYIVTTEQGR